MLVSQYIYTACGKERTGAFSVFSKSKDITNEESAEIREVMMYKTPSGLPYEPTEQEIEELFPKKFGYFFLSSGRACLAQVCYVGRVYSESDGRFGNYIIHAFVFEKTVDFSPYSFIEHAIFKRKLTKKEWHDDPIPDELPKIELPENGGVLSAGEIAYFFNEDCKNKLKLIIEATVNSSNEKPVWLYDEPKNHKYWFKILSACLPKTKQNTVSVCTHFTNTVIPGNISSRIQIRVNQPSSSQFNYAQEAQKGKYAFDLQKNTFPNVVKTGKYSEMVVMLLSSGIFEVIKFTDNINKIMSNHSVNINEASDLINLNKADYSSFENADEIFNTILTAERVGYGNQSIAASLWSKKPTFDFTEQQRLNILSFVYKNTSSLDTKIGIIKTIFDAASHEASQLGLRTDNASVFYEDVNIKANFVLANYYDYLKTEGMLNYVKQNNNSFLKLFFTFDFLTNLPDVKKSLQTKNYNASDETVAVVKIMETAFNRQSSYDINLLMSTANSRINGLGSDLLSALVQNTIKSGKQNTNAIFSFEVLRQLRSKATLASEYLLCLIKQEFSEVPKNISGQDDFIKIYIDAQEKDPDFFEWFENENKTKPLVKNFCKSKDIFYFANQPPSFKGLKEYFDKHYASDSDKGLFITRLGNYLDAVPSEKKLNECNNVIKEMKFHKNVDNALSPPMYTVILEAMFSVSYDKIYDLRENREWLETINEIYNTVTNAKSRLKQETDELVLITLCIPALKKYGSPDSKQIFFDNIKSNADNDAGTLAKNIEKIKTNKGLEIFIAYYFQYVVNIMIAGAALASKPDYDNILKKLFGKMIEEGDLTELAERFTNGIKKSKTDTTIFVLYLFRKQLLNNQSAFDKKLGNIAEKYFEKLSSGERKVMFSELLEHAKTTEAETFERYFYAFNKKHKGGIFDLFKRRK